MSDNIDLEDFEDEIGIANKPVKNTEGYVKARLVKMRPDTIKHKKKRSSREYGDDLTQKCIKFSFLVDGLVEPIHMSKITGTNISVEPTHTVAKGRGKKKEKPEYNAFTEMCLKLGILTEEDLTKEHKALLDKIKKAMLTISEENPIEVKTKLMSVDKVDGDLETIDVRSLKLAKSNNSNIDKKK